MAVPFYIPNEDNQRSNVTTQPQSATTSPAQTPLQSPNEHLVQFFVETLHLYMANLEILTPPLSPSCCPHNNSYRRSRFFPRSSRRNERHDRHFQMRRNDVRRYLNSTSGDEEYVDAPAGIPIVNPSPTSSSSINPAETIPSNFNLENHYACLAARETLIEFPGQLPKKKKKESEVKAEKVKAEEVKAEKVKAEEEAKKKDVKKTKGKSKIWKLVLTAVMLAVGYLTSR